MGNQRQYLKEGGFAEYLYEDHPKFKPFEYNGIKAKVILLNADKNGSHSGLPPFSNSSTVYLKANNEGTVIQAKVYVDRKHTLDFDWGHEHRNKGTGNDGNLFPKGVVHVQSYSQINFRNSNNARYMSESEISKYGEILKHFNPNVKFRP